jgi:two-component system chemotaxis response regulator CheB
MPRNALEHVDADHIVALRDIPPLLVAMTNGNAEGTRTMPHRAKGNPPTEEPSRFTCPECHGTLFEIDDQGLLHFRCRVGHAFSAERMAEDHDEALERALWAALRTLEESVELNRRLAERAKRARHTLIARRFEERSRVAAGDAEVLRRMLSNAKRELVLTEGAPGVTRPKAQPAARSIAL